MDRNAGVEDANGQDPLDPVPVDYCEEVTCSSEVDHRSKASHLYGFTAREKWLLVELVDYCKDVLLPRAITNEVKRRKSALWEEITEEINAQCGQRRYVSAIRRLWEYLCVRARRAMFNRRSGVEPRTYKNYVHFTPLLENVARILHGESRPVVQSFSTRSTTSLSDQAIDANQTGSATFNQQTGNQPRTVAESMKMLRMKVAPETNLDAWPEYSGMRIRDFASWFRSCQDLSADVSHLSRTSDRRAPTTYAELVELSEGVEKLQKSVLQQRRRMLVVKAETNKAKRLKVNTENYNLMLETLKIKHALGDLGPANPIRREHFAEMATEKETDPAGLEKEL